MLSFPNPGCKNKYGNKFSLIQCRLWFPIPVIDTLPHEYDEKWLQNKSMGNLNDDLVLQVISCISPRDVARCKNLNKSFNADISNRIFSHKQFVKSSHKVYNLINFSDICPSVFYQLQLDSP